MVDRAQICEQFRVRPEKRLKLKDFDPGWTGGDADGKSRRKALAEEILSQDVTRLSQAQENKIAICRDAIYRVWFLKWP